MKRKELTALFFVGLMISGIVAAAATEAGASGDPFLSLEWLNKTFIPNAVESANNLVDQRFDDLTDELLSSGTVGTELRVKRGDVLQSETGTHVMMMAGDVSISSTGSVVDMTAGEELTSGATCIANHRYLVAEKTTASFTVMSDTAVIRFAGSYEFTPSAETDYNALADALKAMGLFQGSTTAYGSGYDLENAPTRMEGLIMFLRLMGKEDAALAFSGESVTFADVPNWAAAYAAYAYNQGYTKGQGLDSQGNVVFGSFSQLSAKDYMTFLLRALSYQEGIDFNWSTAISDAKTLGVITKGEESLLTEKPFLRSQVVYLSYFSLSAKARGEEVTLLNRLIAAKCVNAVTAQSAMHGLDLQRL